MTQNAKTCQKSKCGTDGPTDRRTDEVTYRVALHVTKNPTQCKASNLSPNDKSIFLENLPPPKGALMIGYCVRGVEYAHLPKTLEQVEIPERFATTLDGQVLYWGKTDADCHLFMSSTMCQMLSEGQKLFIDVPLCCSLD